MFPLVHAEKRAWCAAFVAPQGWEEVRIHFLDGSTRKWGSISSFFLAPAWLGLDDLLVPPVPLLRLVLLQHPCCGAGIVPSPLSGWNGGSCGSLLGRGQFITSYPQLGLWGVKAGGESIWERNWAVTTCCVCSWYQRILADDLGWDKGARSRRELTLVC